MKKNIVYVVFIMLTLLVFIVGGVSYALLSYAKLGNEENSISTNGITFNYKEGSRRINLEEAMPMTDSQGKAQSEYFEFDLSGYTDKSYELPYDITLRKSKDSADIDNAIKLYLTSVDKNGQETEIKLTSFANIESYSHEKIDLSKQNEKLLYSSMFSSETSFSKKFRLRVWISYDADYTQEKFNNAKFDLTVNVYGRGRTPSTRNNEPAVLVAGLYDSNNTLLATWDELVNTYGLDISKDYSPSTDFEVDMTTGISYNFKTNTILGAIIKNNPSLSSAKHLIISSDVTKIGEAALLTNSPFDIIDCPETVTSIGSMAFSGTTILNYKGTLVDPENYNWGAVVVNPYIEGDFAYSDNTKTKLVGYIGASDTVTIPSTVTTINSGAFEYHTELKNVTIPSSVTEIKEVAFAYTGLETVNLEANSSLTKIGEAAFYNTPWFTEQSKNGKVYLNSIQVK